jgi:GNAT superfamily N-acetyltransferase
VAHPIPRSHLVATFDHLMESDTYAKAYIIEYAGKAAGYALTAKTFSQEAGGYVVWIEELFISPAYRGKGLATEFLTFVKQNIEPTVARVRLEVTEHNQDAIRLYQKFGFEFLPYQQMIKE